MTDSGEALRIAITTGGGDAPEAQLFALHMLGEAPGGGIGWRPDSKRIIVWFGDVPGHDPICTAMSGLPDITEATATARLAGEEITVLAISTDTGVVDGLDGDPTAGATDYTCTVGGLAGQATRIAGATGGTAVAGIDAGKIVDTIIDLIESAVLKIDKLTLEPTAAMRWPWASVASQNSIAEAVKSRYLSPDPDWISMASTAA